MSIVIKGLEKKYGKQIAVNNISFELKKGEIVGLLGPNGAGKSTIMKIITSYVQADAGNAEVMGYNIFDDPISVKKNIGYLPESNALYHEMYIKEFLRFIGGIYKVKNLKARIEEVVKIAGLEKEQHKKIGALSKGYKQRVGIAQAIIHDPEVLILDEPTSGLDPNQLVEIRSLIKEIGKEKTVLFSSHIMQEVEAVCDRIIILNNGNLIADNSTKELSKLWKEDIVVNVCFEENVDEDKLKKIQGVNSVAKINDKEYSLGQQKGKDIRAKLYNFAKEENLTLLELKTEELSLEQVFQKLTSVKGN